MKWWLTCELRLETVSVAVKGIRSDENLGKEVGSVKGVYLAFCGHVMDMTRCQIATLGYSKNELVEHLWQNLNERYW